MAYICNKDFYMNSLKAFLRSEQIGGVLLIICTLFSLSISNSSFAEGYHKIWDADLGILSVEGWINDALMAIFFLFVGLEIKRQLYIGELSNVKKAMLPIFAAIGGMLIPALFYMIFNYGTPTQGGFGIPMATDIAFALAVLTLLGDKVPLGLKIFLSSLAIIDDLGAILVIAFFYPDPAHPFQANYLFFSLLCFIALLLLNRFKMKNLFIYLIGGIFMWFFMLKSGIHTTIAGVLLAFALPFDGGSEEGLSTKIEHWLTKPVTFIILPLFALANTAITLGGSVIDAISHEYSVGIFVGLVLGKPVGIFLMSLLVVSLKMASLPDGVKWLKILGVSLLGGIGFTMSIFVANLAFSDSPEILNNAKLSILISSTVAGIIGYLILFFMLRKQPEVK